MTLLFEPITIGRLEIRNRMMRSATAERLGDVDTGAPQPHLAEMYRALAAGGVGLIVTGHACVEMAGKAHQRMTAIDSDALIPAWRDTIAPAQKAGALVMLQINHSGASTDTSVTPDPISPSGVPTGRRTESRAMTESEALRVIEAFGQGARRAREAGFDGVQIHGAHGYLVTQFLSSLTNQRQDRWGGDAAGRRTFLKEVIQQVRRSVGDDYPVWIKLGAAGEKGSGLDLADGAAVAAICADLGLDCIEISHALGTPEGLAESGDARYRPLAEAVRLAVGPDYPLALVAGFQTREGMEQVLDEGLVQMVSLCRPLIADPNLPNRLQSGARTEVDCVRCDRCRPGDWGDWVRCRNKQTIRKVGG